MGGAPDCEANPCEGGAGRQTPLYVLQILDFSGLQVGGFLDIARGRLDGAAPRPGQGLVLGAAAPQVMR